MALDWNQLTLIRRSMLIGPWYEAKPLRERALRDAGRPRKGRGIAPHLERKEAMGQQRNTKN